MAGGPVADGKSFDVLGLGIVTVDDFLYVDRYPSVEDKTRVNHRLRQCGGLTGTALVAAARLGAKVAYAGVLGDDELSDFIRRAFDAEGIDLTHVNPHLKRPPIHSTIIVDESAHTRTVLFDAEGSLGDEGDWPPRNVIRSTRVLFIDHKNAELMIRAAQFARAEGIPVVADFERDEGPRFAELRVMPDHLIVGRDFAARLTGTDDPARQIDALWSDDRAVVVVTRGDAGGWFSSRPGTPPTRYYAFRLPVVDTTGCGDVFHGAYAATLALGLPLPDRIRWASAASALKTTQRGGQAGIPTRIEVEAFLGVHPE